MTALRKNWFRVDPQGMAMQDGAIIRQVAWADLKSVGRVVPIRGVETSFGGSSAKAGSAVAAGVNRAAQQLGGSIGLLGVGSLTPAEGSNLAATIIQQNEGAWGHDESGTPLVGITPQDVVDDWYTGRIGDWLRHHRPDLASEYERQTSKPAA